LPPSTTTPGEAKADALSKKDVLQLYEKLYFHEVDSREKLNARLQMPLALIISLIGVVAFLLQNYEHRAFTPSATLFSLFLTAAIVALIAAIYFFILSWYGNTYAFVPSATEIEKYRQTLYTTYEPYDKGNALAANYFHDYLLRSYIDSSSVNTACNDNRSVSLHKTNTALIVTAVITFVAFLMFFFGGLQKGQNPKVPETKIEVTIKAEGVQMSNDPKGKAANPPPPPPPPPLRQIREGVEVVKPQPPSQANPRPPKEGKNGK
jgi:hypothetical protein